MRVAYVLPITSGGIPHYTAELVNSISRYIEPIVLKPKDSNDTLFKEGITILHAFKPIVFSRRNPINFFSFKNIKSFFSFNNINKIVEDINPDVIHFTNLYPQTSLFIRLHRIDCEYPVVCTHHSVYLSNLAPPSEFGYFGAFIRTASMLMRDFVKASKIIVHTHRNRNTLIRRGVDPDRVVIIPHGSYTLFTKFTNRIKRNLCNNDSIDNIILYFGYISQNKGIDYLIRASLIVFKSISDAKVIIAGEGDLSKYRKIIEKNSNKFKIYNEFVPNEMAARLFDQAKVVVLPYVYHPGHSGVLMIALAFGKPVVVTNVGDLPTTVRDMREGLVVPPRDPKALANAIITLMEDDKLRKKMSRNALKRAEELSWDNIAKEHVKVYEEIVR